jgi:hypothetical protein
MGYDKELDSLLRDLKHALRRARQDLATMLGTVKLTLGTRDWGKDLRAIIRQRNLGRTLRRR